MFLLLKFMFIEMFLLLEFMFI